MTASWNGVVVAESDDIVTVEGNAYFPAASLDPAYVRPTEARSICPWKGEAHYYDLVVDGEVNPGAVWFYPAPKPAAAEIAGRVAFWRGVEVR